MTSQREILAQVTKEELFTMAVQMLSIPSYPEVGTHELAVWLSEEMRKEDLVVQIEPARGSTHVNLVVEYPGKSERSLLLNGHIDTVPLAEPAQPVERDGLRLSGRGAADMKGAVAAMCYALIALRRANVELEQGVILSAVAGEEIGGFGTHAFLETGRSIEMAIIGEPTNLKLVTAHKGVEWLEISFAGVPGHASCPKVGANAVVAASHAVIALLEDNKQGKISHALLGSPTLNIGVIHAGEYPNVIPDHCVLRIDRRWLPEESVEEAIAHITQVVESAVKKVPGVSIHVSRMSETQHCCPMEVPLTHRLVKAMQEVLLTEHLSTIPQGVPYGTDGSWLFTYGIPCVVCGPGSIEQAHSSEEYVDLEELWAAFRIYVGAILRLCRADVSDRDK